MRQNTTHERAEFLASRIYGRGREREEREGGKQKSSKLQKSMGHSIVREALPSPPFPSIQDLGDPFSASLVTILVTFFARSHPNQHYTKGAGLCLCQSVPEQVGRVILCKKRVEGTCRRRANLILLRNPLLGFPKRTTQ